MNWLKNIVRPKLKQLVGGQKEIPENLWHKCPSCEKMIFHRDLKKSYWVCNHCSHHLRLGSVERLKMLFDDGEFQSVDFPEAIRDPIKFKDLKKYTDRLREAESKTGLKEALFVSHGRIGGIKVVIAALDFSFMGGSMGVSVGEGVITAARLAVLKKAPLIVVSSSGGARMQEGVLSLMQMARTTIAIDDVKDAGLPYIAVLTDPTTGGVSASFAMLGDVAIAESGAVIGFAGARVIEQTIGEKLPQGFQRAEYLKEHGMIDIVVPRQKLRGTLIRVISLLINTNLKSDHIKLETFTE